MEKQLPWAKLIPMGSRFKLREVCSDQITIGSDPTNDIRIEHPQIHSNHCSILKTGEFQASFHSNAADSIILNDEILGLGQTVALENGDVVVLSKNSVGEADSNVAFIFTFVFSKLKRSVPPTELEEYAPRTKLNLTGGQGLNGSNTTEEKAPEELDGDKSFSKEMNCGICLDIIYNCVTLLPCLHNFCGACISSWMKKKVCPLCKEPINRLKKNPQMNNLIDMMLRLEPEKQKPEAERQEMDQKDYFRDNQELLVEKHRRLVAVEGMGSEEEYSDESAEMQDQFVDSVDLSCPECTAPRMADGFQCQRDGLHVECGSCRRNFPNRAETHAQRCALCSNFFCSLYLGGCPGWLQLMLLKNYSPDPRLNETLFRGNESEFQVRKS
jgi:E3 ubiquitin-protein ligase CHFR